MQLKRSVSASADVSSAEKTPAKLRLPAGTGATESVKPAAILSGLGLVSFHGRGYIFCNASMDQRLRSYITLFSV